MILCANECPLSRWKGFFFACRTAVRTQAGLKVAEFILPLLVLDRICFATPKDEEVIRREFLKVLSFGSTPTASMEKTEREKAVNAVFNVVDTLRKNVCCDHYVFWLSALFYELSYGRMG